jgi:ketosteroid isomerase-like protein
MKVSVTLAVVVFLFTASYSYSQNKSQRTGDKLQTQIEVINSKTEQLYLNEDIDQLIGLYTDQLTFFPEYKAGIFDIEKLAGFYKDWFKAVDIKTYKKTIHTVEVFSDHVLEIGTFNLTYSSIQRSQNEYKGKYMILWKTSINGNLNIVSEAFGADKYIEPEAVPYADVQIEETIFTAKHNVSSQLLAEIEESNAVVIKAVAEGDAETRANGFTEDGILMTNFDSIRVGMGAIRQHMLKTYKPGTSFIVKHTYYRIYDLGNYVLVNGHYKGGWGDSINGGRFDGNMSNFMKRDKNGKLLMHRQLGNRDRKLILFNN